ncbi:DEHA2G03608p [Debaryomyces hansenii CBS767]|uniref:DEHA2G03608p n=1 Tax=Debaryomyces hansenii (strain ATCC 36239 / CBS 767 / BCRC 21394 / JCM 1990 / NBRC 0083 / IGC 2968) TaxID=284592 RepID=Q6BJB9_DEBHA|nr:DEHA2G03608p [Debaryomyces hansenii CBS767]CAG90154.2 DEHA2G03608p [Debaryomyces hansenii CBS767]|eukprot:XP_461702.2 DEHA2G03608p [Debaryomyces hansenii CBS767]
MNSQVRYLYKTLIYMGKDYPARSGGYQKFRRQLKAQFVNSPVRNEQDLAAALAKGEYIIKELESLYFLTKYRDIKRKYYRE